MNNVRGVGAKLSYTFPTSGSSLLSLEAGAFNPTSMADHNVWVKEMAFAGKAPLDNRRGKDRRRCRDSYPGLCAHQFAHGLRDMDPRRSHS